MYLIPGATMVQTWRGTWSLKSHLITVAILKNDLWGRPGILEGSRAGPRAVSPSRWLAEESDRNTWAILGNVALGRKIHAGYWWTCILSVTYIVYRVDFEEVRWPRDSPCSQWRPWGEGGSLQALLVYTGEWSGIGAGALEARYDNKAPSVWKPAMACGCGNTHKDSEWTGDCDWRVKQRHGSISKLAEWADETSLESLLLVCPRYNTMSQFSFNLWPLLSKGHPGRWLRALIWVHIGFEWSDLQATGDGFLEITNLSGLLPTMHYNEPAVTFHSIWPSS